MVLIGRAIKKNRLSSGQKIYRWPVRTGSLAERHGPRKNGFEHFRRQPPGVLVVPRAMVAVDQQVTTRHSMFVQMAELGFG